MANTKITVMKVGAVQHFVERAYRESSEQQYLRELVVNAIEASASRIVISPEWNAVERENVYRFMIADDGKGMSPEELQKYLNTFGGGGKPIGDAHENYGVGSKTSTLPFNHHGVVTISWTPEHPDGSMVWICRDASTGEYGTRKFETDEGFIDVVAPFGEWAQLKPDFIKDHGTVVVLLGNAGTEDTFVGKDGTGESKAITSYLNKRFFEIPTGVTIEVQELRSTKKHTWPRSLAEARGPAPKAAEKADGAIDRRYNKRTICGAMHYIDYKPRAKDEDEVAGRLAAQGTETMSDGTKVQWFLWEGERPKVHSYAQKGGFIAAVYKNELYDLQVHPAQFRAFGVTQKSVRENLTLIAHPPMTNGTFGVYPDTARNALKIQGHKRAGESLPWAEWGEEFSDRMPAAIRDAMARAASSTDALTLDQKWQDRLVDDYGFRWPADRFVIHPKGDVPLTPTGTVAVDTVVDPPPPTDNPVRPRPPRAPPDIHGPGVEAEVGAERNPKTHRGTKVEGRGALPTAQWSSETDYEPGTAAVWMKKAPGFPNGVVFINPEFPAFLEIRQHWKAQYPAHHEQQIDQIINETYASGLVARIAHSEHFVRDPAWGASRVEEELRSPAALTMAVLGLVSEDTIIGQRLAVLLGARKASK